MTKILLFTDLHSTPEAVYSSPNADGSTTHLENVTKTFGWLAQLVIEHTPGLVVNLGDTVDTTGFIHTANLKCLSIGMTALVGAVEATGSKLYNLLGNHDIQTGKLHNLCWLPQNMVVHEPTVIDYEGYNIALLPWMESVGVPVFDKKRMLDIVLSHVPLFGASMTSSQVEQSAHAFQCDAIVGKGKGKQLKATNVFSGHYHRPSKVNNNAQVIGSVLYRTFKDAFTVQDYDSKVHDAAAILLELDGPKLTVTRIPNPHSHTFLTARVTTKEDIPRLKKLPKHIALRVELDPELRKAAQAIQPSVAYLALKAIPVMPVSRESGISSLATPKGNLLTYLDAIPVPENLDKSVLTSLVEANISDAVAATDRNIQVEFDHIEISNFLSLGEVAFFYMPSGITGLRGNNKEDGSTDNGSGKSSLMIEAPYWALTGKCLTKLISGDDVIREGSDGGTKVTLTLKVNGHKLVISRGRKHKELKNGIVLTVDGEEFTERRAKETAAKLEELLSPRFEKFLLQNVLLRDGLAGSFAGLGYADRARLLEEYIDTTPYTQFLGFINGKSAELTNTASTIKSAIMDLDIKLASIRGGITATVDQINKEQAAQQNAEAETARITEETKTKILEQKTKLSAAMDTKAMFEQVLQEASSGITERQEELRKLTDAKTKARIAYGSASAELDRVSRLHNAGKCPTCGSPSAYTNEFVTDLSTQSRKLLTECTALDSELAGVQTLLDAAMSRVNEARSKVLSAEAIISTSTMAINTLKSQLTSLVRGQESGKDRLASLQATLTRYEVEDVAIRSSIASKQVDSDSLGVMHNHYKFWADQLATKGFRSYLLDHLVGYINNVLIELSPIMLPGALVQLSTTRQTKSGSERNEVMVNMINHRQFGKLSSGERRRVEILLQMALAKVSSMLSAFSCNFMVLDEIFDKLDKSGIESALSLLESFSKNKWLVVTSHNPILSNALDEVWYVSKENGCTKLITDT